jgi:N-acetylmuramoyl-L-alanine amidase
MTNRNLFIRIIMLIGILILPVLMSGNISAVEELPKLDELAGDIVFMQIQKGGGFLFEDGEVLKLGRYSAVINKDLYKWKIIEYPANSGNHILQNIATSKVLDENLSLKSFDNSNGQFWNLSESPAGNIYSTYNIKNVLKNQNIDGNLTSGIITPTLASPNTGESQKVNFINVNDSYSYSIMGTSTISKEAVRDYLISKIGSSYFNSTAPIYEGASININQYYNRVLDAYYSIAPVYGVRPEVALAQAFHETGFMKFGNLVTIDDFNFAGIYATGSPITETEAANLRGADPNKVELIVGDMAARFKTIEYGVEAHIHHLIGYTTNIALTDINSDGVKEIMGVTLASPRFELLNMLNKRNTGQILPALNGQWAVPGYVYGQMIMNMVKGIPAPIITKAEISEGIYAIDSIYSTLRLDANNTLISQNSINNTNSQIWNIEQVSDKEYRIVSIRSGKALSIRNNKVVHDTWAGDDLQLWTFSPNSNGGYKILSVGNNKSLSLATESKTNGVAITTNSDYRLVTTDFNLVTASYNKTDLVAETKAVKGVMDGIYNIRNLTSNQLLNVPTEGSFSYVSPNPRNFIQMNQWSVNNTIAQKFKIVRMSTGDFKIIGVNSGKLLTVNDANENGAVFQLYDKYNDFKQLWSIVSNGDGYVLRNSETGKNIIVASTGIQGSGIVQSSTSQDWILTKLLDIPNFVEKTKALAGKVIWIDPGHGSAYNGYFDPGAVRTGIREVDSNTWYSIELAERLRAGGATVLLTRTTADPGLTIDNRQRAYLASEANADIFISVHSNASTNTSANGAETYYYLPSSVDDPNYAATKDYDQRIVRSIVLANLVNPKMAAGGGFVNKGVKGADFAVIRETAMPAILLEIGFISNSGDLAKIMDANNRTNTVNGIYQGIIEYFEQYGTSQLPSEISDILNVMGLKNDNTYISGININTNSDTLTANIKKVNANAEVIIRDSNNNVKSNRILATNDSITITIDNETKLYNVIIYGDTNGDGSIDIIDLLRVQKLILRTMSATEPYLRAADTNKDGNVDIIDLLRVQKHVLGSTSIQQ